MNPSSGKVVLITGGSSGIGYQTALELAFKRYTVYITGRNKEKTVDAVQKIKNITHNHNIDYFLSDFSDLNSVREMGNCIISKLERLDVLINNAGGVNSKFELTKDGYEKTFASNHLAGFLLTNMLLDLLIQSSPSRIINVSSDSHFKGKLNLSEINKPDNYFIMQAYANSKLCNVLFTYELSRKLQDKGVLVNCLHPGVVNTRIGQKNTRLLSNFVWMLIANTKGVSLKKGAETSVYLAESNDVSAITGKYFEKCKIKNSSPISYDQNLAKELWEMSSLITGIEK